VGLLTSSSAKSSASLIKRLLLAVVLAVGAALSEESQAVASAMGLITTLTADSIFIGACRILFGVAISRRYDDERRRESRAE